MSIDLHESRVSSPTADPVSQLEKDERHRLVKRLLGRLPPAYREVIILREYHNLSYEDIAAVTRSTVSSVKSRLFKARRKLADHLRTAVRAESRDHVLSDML